MKKILLLIWLTILRKIRLHRNERLRSIKLDINQKSEKEGGAMLVLTVYSTHDRKVQASIAAPWLRFTHAPALGALEMVVSEPGQIVVP